MLALPIQNVTPSDSRPAFNGFVNLQFGPGSHERYDYDIAGFQTARDAALSITESSGEAGLFDLLHIIFELKNMAPRLAEYEIELKLSFAYVDAFKPTKVRTV